jgi:hypothetical protein
MKILDFIRGLRVAYIERRLRRYKETLVTAWRDELEDEYEDKFTAMENETFRLNKVIKEERQNTDYWHGKYDALEKVYDGIKGNIIQKVEDNAIKVGEQKEQVKNLKKDLKEKTE